MNNNNTFSRRDLVPWLRSNKHMALAGAAGLTLASSAAARRRSATLAPTFVVKVALRGGMDGLSAVVPFDDMHYQGLRIDTQLYAPGAGPDAEREVIVLDNSAIENGPAEFGIPKALAPLHDIYRLKKLAFIHATGNIDGVQSHFAAQDSMDKGWNQDVPGGPPPDGWLGRHLQLKLDHGPAIFRAMSYGSTQTLSLLGGPGATPVADPPSYELPAPLDLVGGWSEDLAAARRLALVNAYQAFGAPLEAAMDSTVEAVDVLDGIDFGGYPQAPLYPDTPLGTQFKHAAQIGRETDVEAVTINYGGWDTHKDQGVYLDISGEDPVPGQMYSRMQELADALRAFHDDMSNHGPPFLVLVVTEFGRKAPENGSLGTDHGKGGVAMVCGTNVKGGQLYGSWPGLDPDSLDDLDLAVTTDIRDVMWEVAEKALFNPSMHLLFPGYASPVKTLGFL